MLISVFIPHGGCPERCKFCDQSVSGGEPTSLKAVRERISKHLETGKGEPAEVAFYGGTFTALRGELQEEYLAAAREHALPVRIATRPDAIDLDWLRYLRDEYGLKTVELGLQSIENKVLRALGRTHTVEHAERALAVLKELGLESGVHLLLGSPEESASVTDTVDWLVRHKPGSFRLHPLLVLKDTLLEVEMRQGRFKPLELEPAVDEAARLVAAAERAGVPCIRLGLQPNEVLASSVVGGAFHPAFGELVRARIWRGEVERELRSQGVETHSKVEIETSAKLESQIKGHGLSNVRYFESTFALPAGSVTVVRGPHAQSGFRLKITNSRQWLPNARGASERREV